MLENARTSFGLTLEFLAQSLEWLIPLFSRERTNWGPSNTDKLPEQPSLILQRLSPRFLRTFSRTLGPWARCRSGTVGVPHYGGWKSTKFREVGRPSAEELQGLVENEARHSAVLPKSDSNRRKVKTNGNKRFVSGINTVTSEKTRQFCEYFGDYWRVLYES